jgi:hypothetical protein
MPLLLAAFLLAHGAIHASFLSPRPPVTASGPAWPFELSRSWLLTPLGVGAEQLRLLGIALTAVTVAAFAVAALAALGPLAALWVPAVVLGSTASIALLVLFFHPWLSLGIVIDAVLVWAVAFGGWSVAGAFQP